MFDVRSNRQSLIVAWGRCYIFTVKEAWSLGSAKACFGRPSFPFDINRKGVIIARSWSPELVSEHRVTLSSLSADRKFRCSFTLVIHGIEDVVVSSAWKDALTFRFKHGYAPVHGRFWDLKPRSQSETIR